MRLLALVPIALAACSPTADVTAGDGREARAIINGADCDEATDPTAIAVLFDGTLDMSAIGAGVIDVTTVECTGTLIAPDVVLTAAHCTDPSLLTGGLGTVQRADYYVTRQADLEALTQGVGQGPPPALPRARCRCGRSSRTSSSTSRTSTRA